MHLRHHVGHPVQHRVVGVDHDVDTLPEYVEVGVGHRLLELVRDDARHPVGAGVAVRARRLRGARAGAPVRVADERILDVDPVDRGVRVPAAVLRAEPRGGSDVRGGQHEIDAIRIGGNPPLVDRARHHAAYGQIGKRGSPRIVVVRRARVRHRVADAALRAVVIGRIDVVIGRSADRAGEVGQDRRRRVARPVAVPDVIDVRAAEHHRAAVIEDAVALQREGGGLRLSLSLAGALPGAGPRRGTLAPALAGRNQLVVVGGVLDGACAGGTAHRGGDAGQGESGKQDATHGTSLVRPASRATGCCLVARGGLPRKYAPYAAARQSPTARRNVAGDDALRFSPRRFRRPA